MKGILRGLLEHEARTDPGSDDPRLRGRTYAIPFETVWQASLALGRGGLRGWSLGHADDQIGVIDVLWRTFVFGIEADIRIEIGLDQDAQTRVDLRALSRNGRGDLGRNRRAIGRFTRKLDRLLDPRPGQVLDPTRSPRYESHP
ncbi:MAG: DUF1499 domain-containing protein [Gemmatimonadetes bacterium]|nr:DUF1499 domain-containing protein [Gemmatimonadota bacterium]MDA1104157.1 DUF1499 domain-containing protein [Gemmatimonadota bacterium]